MSDIEQEPMTVKTVLVKVMYRDPATSTEADVIVALDADKTIRSNMPTVRGKVIEAIQNTGTSSKKNIVGARDMYATLNDSSTIVSDKIPVGFLQLYIGEDQQLCLTVAPKAGSSPPKPRVVKPQKAASGEAESKREAAAADDEDEDMAPRPSKSKKRSRSSANGEKRQQKRQRQRRDRDEYDD